MAFLMQSKSFPLSTRIPIAFEDSTTLSTQSSRQTTLYIRSPLTSISNFFLSLRSCSLLHQRYHRKCVFPFTTLHIVVTRIFLRRIILDRDSLFYDFSYNDFQDFFTAEDSYIDSTFITILYNPTNNSLISKYVFLPRASSTINSTANIYTQIETIS